MNAANVILKPFTLRERIAQLSPAFHAQEQQRKAIVAMQAQAQLTMLQKAAAQERAEALARAKAALGKSNIVARKNSKLGNALKSVAMRDMNSLRSKCSVVAKLERVCAIVQEYSNLGSNWSI